MSELNLERSSSLDWDLQAVVKAETLNRFTTTSNNNNNNNNNNNVMVDDMPPSYSWLEDYYTNHENATLLLDELHQICTPNYHNITTSNVSSSEIGLDNTVITTTIDDQPKQKIGTTNPVVVPKRRKNKHKKTSVHQATGDRVAFDKWNWRKYGEKVIKGSPYPRSYYRCSSNSEGCLARKQVEQSCKDPGMFQITYIDDHTHPYPRHRPSQAGRTSRRFHASQIANSNPDNNGATSAPVIAKDLVFVHWDNNKDFDDMLFADLEGFEIDF